MIVEKDHFAQIGKVLAYFDDQVKEYKSIGTAYVTTAMELSDAQKAAVVKRLLETTKYVTFEMHYEVDSAIIGGMMIRIGDRVVDSTVRTKLYDLTRELSKIQLKAGECAP
jgi:F-type H+-transporting ATPase subunit delta